MSPRAESLVSYTDDGHGEPVVFLHAFPLDGRMWQRQREDLARAYRVLVPDLAGFGRSADVPLRTSLDAHADDIALLLDRVGAERATVVGLSMGGYIALAFARRHPARLARLVLADTKATPDTPDGKVARDGDIAFVATDGASALVERRLPKLLSPNAASDVVAFVRSVGGSQPAASLAAALAAMRDRPDTTPVLARVGVPTAILVGDADEITTLADARAMSNALPSASLDVVAGAGHLANLEAPAAFSEALVRFLGRRPFDA
jgi:pimeloyl-ACP methyl ester carboxylesterase